MREEELIYEHIGKRIRELRQSHPRTQRKTTQEQLALACNIERSTLANIERCNQRPSIFLIYRVCRFFGINLTDVLRDPDSVYLEKSLSVEIGSTVHRVSGGKTADLIKVIRSKRA